MPKTKVTAKWVENVRTIAEMAIMSLADCAVTIFADVCKKSNIEISKMEVVAEADKPADSPKLTGVNIKVTVASKARDQKLNAVWRRTEANCPVVSIFKDNIPINVEFETTAE
jgi:uncharacterized OsmC-like protein